MIRNTYFCPIKKLALSQANPAWIKNFNTAVQRKSVRYISGEILHNISNQFLLNLDAEIGYQVMGGIPQLLPQLAISLGGLKTGNSVD